MTTTRSGRRTRTQSDALRIATAPREGLIQNPYFAPNDGVVELFAMMVRRGVKVHLMVPGKHTDSPFVRRAGCSLYTALLEAGVRLYEFEPTLLHQKIVVVDEIWSHIGSTNFDARSLSLNEEVGIGVRDASIANQLKGAFENDLRRSKELSLEQWRAQFIDGCGALAPASDLYDHFGLTPPKITERVLAHMKIREIA